MKPSPHSTKAARAFTLIELLVVIAIIAILIGLLFPAFSAVREASKKVVAHNDETQILASIKAYFVEYQKYPVAGSGTTDAYFGPATTGPGGASVTTNDVLFDVLRNNTASTTNSSSVTTLNPRGIVFLDVPFVKTSSNPVSGIVPNTATATTSIKLGAWHDAWGSEYNILMDTNYDNNVINPYASAGGGSDSNPPGSSPISTGVIVWSYGKNGALGGGSPASGSFSSEPGSSKVYTGSGDVISWQ